MPERPPNRPPAAVTLIKLGWCCLLASVVAAGLMFPVVGGFGLVSNRASDVVANGSAQLVEGEVPGVSTMVDAKGNVIAWLYSQRRFEVPGDQIANTMKLAIVSIEDKRFAEHNGVDWQGTLTGLSGYMSGNLDTRGGSTIEQQYVKNYLYLVEAKTEAEKADAIATTPIRKLREAKMALSLEQNLSKAEILERYLNLVAFGPSQYGAEAASQWFFGTSADNSLTMTLDINHELFPCHTGEQIQMVLATTLSLDGTKEETSWRSVSKSGTTTLADMYDYVCYGKNYRFEDGDGDTL